MSDNTSPPAGLAPAPGRPTVLLADDEAAVRRVATTILESHDFRVLNAEDGRRVLEVFEAARGQVALVILDMIMPGPGVEATLAALWAADPGARVLLMSGYAEPELPPETRRRLRGFLGKPFRGSELLRAVREAIANPHG
jgi:DNA-binding NtrC family response regulator